MNYHDLEPIVKPHTNGMLAGRPARPDEEGVIDGQIGGLPYTDTGNTIVSVWKCRSLFWRLRFLLKGEITLTVLGHGQPPIALSVGDTLASAKKN